jgi:hypothetical protein
MRAKLLTFVTLAAMLVGGMAWTSTAEARPWRGYYGGYYSGYAYGPTVTYYRPYYRPYYAYPNAAYSYGYYPAYRTYYPAYPTYYPRYYAPGIYVGAAPVGVYVR